MSLLNSETILKFPAGFANTVVWSLLMKFGEYSVSEEFYQLILQKIYPDFEEKTGLNLNVERNIQYNPGPDIQYVRDNKSIINSVLLVNNLSCGEVPIIWYSISGRIVELDTEDINFDDVVMYLELDLNSFIKAYNYTITYFKPKKQVFKLKNQNIEIEVKKLDTNVYLLLFFKDHLIINVPQLHKEIIEKMVFFNDLAVKGKYKKQGVVHNISEPIVNHNECEYYIDLGSSGIKFIKLILQYINDTGWVYKAVIS